MKLISIFQTLIMCIILLNYGCEKHTEPPCSGMSCDPTEDGKILGWITLNDSNNYWLGNIKKGYGVNKIISNKAGATSEYSIYYNSGYDHVYLNKYQDTTRTCCSGTYIQDYLKSANQILEYSPQNDGLRFSLVRYTNVSATLIKNDSIRLNSRSEHLSLRIYGRSYEYTTLHIIPDTSFKSNNQIFHNQISLHNKIYHSIFEIIDTKVDPNKILPKGFYFSFEDGIVGYYLTNKELWAER